MACRYIINFNLILELSKTKMFCKIKIEKENYEKYEKYNVKITLHILIRLSKLINDTLMLIGVGS